MVSNGKNIFTIILK